MTRYRPSVSGALQSVVMRCLAKHPADRWQTAQELLTALEPLLTPSGGTTPAQTIPMQPAAVPAAGGRQRRGRYVGAVLLALGAMLLGWALTHRSPRTLSLGRRTQLTLDPGLEIDPALSPDGKFVAYSAGPAGIGRIMVRQLDGGGTIELTSGVSGDQRRPQWTPDGSRVEYQSARGIELVPALGGSSRMLVASSPGDTAADLAWSPDGARIVYRRGDSLYVRDTGGGPPRPLVKGGEVYAPSWSPDGRWIAYVSGNPLFLYGPRSQLGNFAPSRIMVVPAAGGTTVEVAAGNSLNLSPVWLPTGRQLLFVSNRDGGRDVYRVTLTATGGAATPPERLTTGLNASTISLTPDGRRLAYATFAQTANVWSLAVTSPWPRSSRDARPVTTGNQIIESFDVSHDGKWLAFDSDRNGNQDIFRMPLPGGQAEQLTSDPGDDFQPSWSHSDREIGFHAFRNGHDRDLYVMSATGTDQRPVIATPAQDRDAGWSPDDQRMSFASDVGGTMEVYTVARDGSSWGTPVQLIRSGGIGPNWSPDGRTVAYNALRGGVWLVPASGGTPKPLPMTGQLTGKVSDFFAFTWMPDSRRILVVVSADSMPYQAVWSVPIDGGSPTMLLTMDDPSAFGRGTFVVRDTTIYFAQLRSESDIWTADLAAR
jgi:TolB protein